MPGFESDSFDQIAGTVLIRSLRKNLSASHTAPTHKGEKESTRCEGEGEGREESPNGPESREGEEESGKIESRR